LGKNRTFVSDKEIKHIIQQLKSNLIMSTLNGKTIVIDGVEYRLVAVENEDTRTKAIISMETPFGYVQQVVDRDVLRDGVEEGNIEVDGKHFVIEFCEEDEVEGKVGKPISELNPIDMLMMSLAEIMSEADKKEN
jgi:hypothetical protein